MPNTNIRSIDYSDNQSQIVDKLNNNFDEIVELHGGTIGTTGPTGPDGAIGERGAIGITGFTGTRGTRWFVSGVAPAGSAQEGDYWIDSNSSLIYQLDPSGWNSTGYNIRTGGSLFSSVNSAYSTGSGRAIQIDQVIPKNYLFVLADVTPESEVLNELLSKFAISTDSLVNDSPLMEFSRTDMETGNVSDYSLHPVFYWASPNPSDNSLGFRVPGGNLNIGVTGGFESSFDKLNIDSQSSVYFGYGVSGGSIFATGGYSLATPSEFNLISKNASITGGSGSFYDPLFSEATLDSSTPHTKITAKGTTSGIRSTRTGDNSANLSHTVYHLNFESNSDSELFLSTKGKFRTKKTTEGVSYSSNTPSYQVQNGATSWFFISRTSTPYTVSLPSSVLNDGNTIIINPSVLVNTNIGIGFYNGDDYSWGGSGGLKPGESMDIRVYNSSDSTSPSVSGFKYIGVGTGGTGGTAAVKVTLPFFARSIDFTLAKGPTGTTVYWRTYAPWPSATTGGTGGSFIY